MRCCRCMKIYPSEYEVCPHCGYVAKHEKAYYLMEGTLLFERYYIGVVLGCGGFGIIYKAYDTMLDVVVALKEYYPQGMVRRAHGSDEVCVCITEDEQEYRAGLYRFLAEARMLARFSKHENIVNVYNYYEKNHTAYIVMEYLEGMTMKVFLENNGGIMPVSDAEYVIRSVARALQSLHGEGILHRDISPDNIYFCSDGRVKLIDFGAAKLAGPGEFVGKVVVKVGYAPPEQYRAKGMQGAFSDLYALGATFYRGITGVVPTESLGRLKQDHLAPPRNFSGKQDGGIPDYINNVILKLMMIEPEDRFQSASELLDVLQRKKVVSLVSGSQRKVHQKKRRRMVMTISGSVLVLSLFGLLIYGMRYRYYNTSMELVVRAEDEWEREALQHYYEEVNESFLALHPELKLEVRVFTADMYAENVAAELKRYRGGVVYESDGLYEETDKGLQLNHIMHISENDYYFADVSFASGLNENQIPIGMDIPVRYYVEHAGGIREELSYDRASEYEEAKAALYGTYDDVPQEITGSLLLEVPESADIYWTTVLSAANVHGVAKRAEKAYLEYLLSEEGQKRLHCQMSGVISESNALSVNRHVDMWYRHEICSSLSVLDDVLTDKLKP